MVSGLELAAWRKQAQEAAIAANIPPSEVDGLLRSLSSLDTLSLRLESFKSHADIPFSRPWLDIQQLWKERIDTRVPLQYLIGELTWRDLELHVAPGVLIPRPETELFIDLVLASHVGQMDGDWADLGTGSGAIAIGLAQALPQITVHAVDRSPEALAIARVNAAQYPFNAQIQFYQGCWFTPLHPLKGQLVGMVSNPPYIPTGLINQLQPEVADHEPHLALDGGSDGLDCIRTLISAAPDYLCSGGLWIVEMMAGQAEPVEQLLVENGNYRQIEIHKDLAGIERFALASRR
ncbi:peptide chain release factor N(5)-glutamine methyltransferase [Roseofilum reptotaenium CS-1145]|uniref:Release factor glutamine methyltransferase n=1 Tax=Roseofilum reptotaenium AO1-A TaxID=1925591 RepID=A0A1L9QMW1_9CYAN|nr:peptide chain release factor N(5)-glutamine methyltransferase [Roseofilum reptotaenium]MDB9517192.1 peptide chain release factor N(5)-glutamine methyltransferase [Roseofilum reptotaenium CS-1145]OJJ22768.1 protein-(glutamine-N5) methyltransferase, release factor-specific [Roseofilum reptotaenium AO1-A]